jgi:glycosyltransferase involved in cell wall biosynthesis
MKILYVGHTYTVRANHAKIAALAKQPGVEITLVTPHAWKGPLYENKADRFDTALAKNVDHQILRAYLIGKEGAYFFGPRIFSIIAKLQPDVVHVEQGPYGIVYTQILLALKLLSPRSRALFFTWWNLPYVPKGIKRLTERFNLRNSAAAVAGNIAALDILRKHKFSNPIHVLPQLGIEVETMPQFRARNEIFTIGYAGRISEEKGVLDLVTAAGQMAQKDIRLYFVGAGEALDSVKREAAYRGIDFEHHPAVRNDELQHHLAKMDVLVLPSRSTPEWVEQFGHILLEAMAVGLPVVGSSSGEIPNVIGDGGLIFDESNVEHLAQALDSLAQDETKRQKLAQVGFNRARDLFSNDLIARKQFGLYEIMIAEKDAKSKSRNMERGLQQVV